MVTAVLRSAHKNAGNSTHLAFPGYEYRLHAGFEDPPVSAWRVFSGEAACAVFPSTILRLAGCANAAGEVPEREDFPRFRQSVCKRFFVHKMDAVVKWWRFKLPWDATMGGEQYQNLWIYPG